MPPVSRPPWSMNMCGSMAPVGGGMIPTWSRPPAFTAFVPAKASGASPSAPRSVPTTDAETPKMPARRISSLRSNSPAMNSSISVFSIGPASLRRYSSSRLRVSRSILCLPVRWRTGDRVGRGGIRDGDPPLPPCQAPRVYSGRARTGFAGPPGVRPRLHGGDGPVGARPARTRVRARPAPLERPGRRALRRGERDDAARGAPDRSRDRPARGAAADRRRGGGHRRVRRRPGARRRLLVAPREPRGVRHRLRRRLDGGDRAARRGAHRRTALRSRRDDPGHGRRGRARARLRRRRRGAFRNRGPLSRDRRRGRRRRGRDRARARVERPSVGAMLRAVRGHRPVLAAAVLLTAAGCSSSLGFLLVPLRLRSNGVSVGTIGAILGVAALFYVSAGIVAARLGAQVARPAVAGLAVLVLGLAVGLPAL